MPRIAFVLRVASTLSLAAASPASAVECFSMYDAKNALVYQSSTSPINLGRPISEQMTRRFPARHLVISDIGACPVTGVAANTTASDSGAALLPSSTGNGPGAFGADATSPVPAGNSSQAAGEAATGRAFTRAPSGGRR